MGGILVINTTIYLIIIQVNTMSTLNLLNLKIKETLTHLKYKNNVSLL